MNNYNHEIIIDESNRSLKIYRLLEDRKKEFYTSVSVPDVSFVDNPDDFYEFCKALGECILIDSPSARRMFSL